MKKSLFYSVTMSAFILGQGALADSDSSADAGSSFVSTLSSAPGVVLQVKIDAQGREDSSTAVLHVANNSVKSAEELEGAFYRGLDTSSQPKITQADIEADSSTFGFFNNYYYGGWYQPYYYQTYYPSYYYGGYYYTYSYPSYYYNNWNNYYRYYYYPRYW